MCLEISVKSLRKNLDFILSFKTKHRISYKNRDVHSEIYRVFIVVYTEASWTAKKKKWDTFESYWTTPGYARYYWFFVGQSM